MGLFREPTRAVKQRPDRPYKMVMAYDSFGQLTSEISNHWSIAFVRSDTFENNRRVGWLYDAQGNLVGGRDANYAYDAAGRVVEVQSEGSTAFSLDGDGHQRKTIVTTFNEATQSNETRTTYYLTSSVLGGRVLTELSDVGAKKRTFIYCGAAVLGWQDSETEQVVWEHRDPANASYRTTDISGNTQSTIENRQPAELDPTGSNAGLLTPYLNSEPPPEEGASRPLLDYPSNGDPTQWGTSYSRDGIIISRSEAMAMLRTLPAGSLSLLYAAVNTNNNAPPRKVAPKPWFPLPLPRNPFSPPDAIPTDVKGIRQPHWEPSALTETRTLLSLVSWEPQNPIKIDPQLDPRQLKRAHAFSDADSVLLLDKNCRKFFTKGRSLAEVRDILQVFRDSATYDPTLDADASTTNSGSGRGASIKLSDYFFSDDTQRIYTWDPKMSRWVDDFGLVSRQHRAATILHEFAHALGLIPRDGRSADPTGQQSIKNDETIYNNCFRGLQRLPSTN